MPPLKRKKPIRRVSLKRAKALKEYMILRQAFLMGHPSCEIARKDICKGRAGEVHHVKGRGKNLNNPMTWLATCRPCHRWIHEHPGQARVLGFLA